MAALVTVSTRPLESTEPPRSGFGPTEPLEVTTKS
jgi:hypothetical protein